MENKSWKNPYIDKLETLPEYIIACESNEISKDHAEQVQERIKQFSKIYVEIGSGSGMHLINRAAVDPESLYIGFELRFKRTFRTAEKAARDGLKNLVVIRTNAALIADLLPPKSLSGIYVNFPDPWAKKRWKKHRIINTDYLEVLHGLLHDEGFFSYKTDHREYFRSSLALLNSFPLFEVVAHTEDLHGSPYEQDNVHTEFEKLFISQGLSPCFLQAIKVNN